MKFFSLVLLVSFSLFAKAQDGCEFIQNKCFSYQSAISEIPVYVRLKGKKQIEYHSGGKYILVSKIRWIDDCTYISTIKKVTIPNFEYHINDRMTVHIEEKRGSEVLVTCTVGGDSWKNILLIMNEVPKEVIKQESKMEE